eukprot:1816322-Amphidinium_carterae.1
MKLTWKMIPPISLSGIDVLEITSIRFDDHFRFNYHVAVCDWRARLAPVSSSIQTGTHVMGKSSNRSTTPE